MVFIGEQFQSSEGSNTPDYLWDDSLWTQEFCDTAVEDLMYEHGLTAKPYGVYFLNALDPRSTLGRMVEVERFDESFGNGSEYMKELYGKYETSGQTEIMVVIDHTARRPAGVIRTVRNDTELGCPTLNDMRSSGANGWGLTDEEIAEKSAFDATEPDQIIDIATMAVSREYSKAISVGGISKALCAAVFQRSLEDPVSRTWVCALARGPYKLIQAYTNNIMNEFDGVEGRPYHGDADTIPLWSNFRRHAAYVKENKPRLYKRYVLSEGFDSYYFAK